MAALRCLDLTPTGPAVNVIPMSEFLKVRPDFFTVVTRQAYQFFRHDPGRVNVCDRSEERAALFPDSMGGCLKVSNESELERLTERLLRLPLFFTVDLKRLHKSGNTTYERRDAAAVIVNTQHPYIQDHFKGLLTEAMELMRQGKNFAVEFDFNQVMEDWFLYIHAERGEEGGALHTVYRSKHGRITVTNYGEHSEMFSCKNCPTACYYWVFCMPCCLVSYPIYKLQRHLQVVDLGGRVRGVQATTFTSYVSRAEMEVAFRVGVANLIQQRLQEQRAQAAVTQPPQPCEPPSYDSPQMVQGQPMGPGGLPPPQPMGPGGLPPPQPMGPGGLPPPQPRGPYEDPAPIMYGNPASGVV